MESSFLAKGSPDASHILRVHPRETDVGGQGSGPSSYCNWRLAQWVVAILHEEDGSWSFRAQKSVFHRRQAAKCRHKILRRESRSCALDAQFRIDTHRCAAMHEESGSWSTRTLSYAEGLCKREMFVHRTLTEEKGMKQALTRRRECKKE